MPGFLRGVKRDVLTYVATNSRALYAFNTKDLAALPDVNQADLTALGHQIGSIDITSGPTVVFLRAQAPKPPRVKKIINSGTGTSGQQSVSTFCAFNRIQFALDQKWRLTKGGRKCTLSTGKKKVSAIAVLSDGTHYTWALDIQDYNSYKAALGLKGPESNLSPTERNSLVRGASYPKPGKAELIINNDQSFTSFYSSDKEDSLEQAGWKILSGEQII